jgi:hypothetical protein
MTETQIETVRKSLLSELSEALGIKERSYQASLFNAIAKIPSNRLAKIATEFENDVREYGLNIAARNQMGFFTSSISVNSNRGLPEKGPLLIVSNHPGTFDALVIASQLERSDIKIVARNMPFIGNLPSTNEHLIYSTLDTGERMTVVRKVIKQLNEGGTLILFPRGRLEPDPEIMDGADKSIENWSPSIELIMKKVPDTILQIAIVSGMIKRSSLNHPITYIRRDEYQRHILGETVQMVKQLVFPKRSRIAPHMTFGTPLSFEDLASKTEKVRLIQAIILQAQAVLKDHTFSFQESFSLG